MYKTTLFNKNYIFFYVPVRNIFSQKKSHYDVLGITKLATHKEVKTAYYKKCKELHPDKNKDDSKSHNQFVSLNEAYSILSNPNSRRDYDASFNSSYNYPNPTNVYRNTNGPWAKYTYSNPFDDFSRHDIHDEQMRFYREQMRYSTYYRTDSTYNKSAEPSKPVPMRTLFTVALVVCSIFLFDAIFITMTYNHDINHLQRNYAPVYDRRWKKNASPNSIEFSKEEIDPKTYEAEIDEKIREYKEYENSTKVRIYIRDPPANEKKE